MFGKTAVLEGLEKRLYKNASSRVPYRQFELFNPPTYSYTENWLHNKCLMWAFREILKMLGERVIASSFYNSCIGLLRKVALPDIWGNHLLTGVAG